MRRLIEHPGARLGCQRLDALPTAMGLGREEALEAESVRGQPCRTERSDQGAGAGYRRDAHPGFPGLAYQMEAGIGDQWGAGIGDQRHILAGQQDRKSTRLNSSHVRISYAVFCLKKKT